jgi:hypothetical protein
MIYHWERTECERTAPVVNAATGEAVGEATVVVAQPGRRWLWVDLRTLSERSRKMFIMTGVPICVN